MREPNRRYFWNHDFDAENDRGDVLSSPEAICKVDEKKKEKENCNGHDSYQIALRRKVICTHSQQAYEQAGHNHKSTT